MLKVQRLAASVLAVSFIVFASRPTLADLWLSLDRIIGKTRGWNIG
jgi:hypothetical protein